KEHHMNCMLAIRNDEAERGKTESASERNRAELFGKSYLCFLCFLLFHANGALFGQTVPKFPVKTPESVRVTIPEKLSLNEAKAPIDALAKDRRISRQYETVSRIRDAVVVQDLPAVIAYCESVTDRSLKANLMSSLLGRWGETDPLAAIDYAQKVAGGKARMD